MITKYQRLGDNKENSFSSQFWKLESKRHVVGFGKGSNSVTSGLDVITMLGASVAGRSHMLELDIRDHGRIIL